MMKLLGYRKGVSKKTGNPYCQMHVLSDVSEGEKNGGFVGQKTETPFAPEGYVDYLKPEMIGKEIFLDYSISGGRAFLTSISVK